MVNPIAHVAEWFIKFVGCLPWPILSFLNLCLWIYVFLSFWRFFRSLH